MHRYVSLYQAINQSRESKAFSGIVHLMAMLGRGKQDLDLMMGDSPVSYLLDRLLDGLIRDEHDGGVYALFQEACDFKGLIQKIPSIHSIDLGDRILWLNPAVPLKECPLVQEEKGHAKEPVVLMSFDDLAVDALPTNDEGIPCLAISPTQQIDMTMCRLSLTRTLILSATGSFELPECIQVKAGQIIVLGFPLEKLKVPEGFSLISPISSSMFHQFYKGKWIRFDYEPVDPSIDDAILIQNTVPVTCYQFLGLVDLRGMRGRLFSNIIYMLRHAKKKISWDWYQNLLSLYSRGYFPLGKLIHHHSSFPLDLRAYTLETLPLDHSLLMKADPVADELTYSSDPYYRKNDPMKPYLRGGYHVINPDGWKILYLEGLTGAHLKQAFKLEKKYKRYDRLRKDEELDLRDMHPEMMQTLPPREVGAVPLGIDRYYCESLVRNYHSVRQLVLAIVTFALSRLIFFIQHVLRQRLIRRLPQGCQEEVSRILSPFKWRPIAQPARDYLRYRFAWLPAVQAMSRMDRNLLFGCLPKEGAQAYFESMQYCPLFGTQRELNKFGRRLFTGNERQKSQKIDDLRGAIAHVTPWMKCQDALLPDERNQKDQAMTRRLLALLMVLRYKPSLRRKFVSQLVKPENIYFMSLFISLARIIDSKLRIALKPDVKSLWSKWRKHQGHRVRDIIFSVTFQYDARTIHRPPEKALGKDQRYRFFSFLCRFMADIDRCPQKYATSSGIDYLLELQSQAKREEVVPVP